MSIAYFNKNAIYYAVLKYSEDLHDVFDDQTKELKRQYLRKLLISVVGRNTLSTKARLFCSNPLNVRKWRGFCYTQQETNDFAVAINELLVMSTVEVARTVHIYPTLTKMERQRVAAFYTALEILKVDMKERHHTLNRLVDMCDLMTGDTILLDGPTFSLLRDCIPAAENLEQCLLEIGIGDSSSSEDTITNRRNTLH